RAFEPRAFLEVAFGQMVSLLIDDEDRRFLERGSPVSAVGVGQVMTRQRRLDDAVGRQRKVLEQRVTTEPDRAAADDEGDVVETDAFLAQNIGDSREGRKDSAAMLSRVESFGPLPP